MRRVVQVLLLAFVGLLAVGDAAANLFVWHLQDVTYGDGGVATGSFTWDSGSGFAVVWSIAVSGGNEVNFPPVTYSSVDGATGNLLDGTLAFIIDLDLPTERFMRIKPLAPLDGPGPIGIDTSIPNDAVECFNCGPYRFLTGGSLVAPEPSDAQAAALLALSLMALKERRGTRRCGQPRGWAVRAEARAWRRRSSPPARGGSPRRSRGCARV